MQTFEVGDLNEIKILPQSVIKYFGFDDFSLKVEEEVCVLNHF